MFPSAQDIKVDGPQQTAKTEIERKELKNLYNYRNGTAVTNKQKDNW
jgi:hypothetical protein